MIEKKCGKDIMVVFLGLLLAAPVSNIIFGADVIATPMVRAETREGSPDLRISVQVFDGTGATKIFADGFESGEV